MQEKLTRVAQRLLSGARVEGLSRLTGGANQQMWSLEAVSEQERMPMILRQASTWNQGAEGVMQLDDEARLVIRAGAGGVPVPRVHEILRPEDGLGTGYLMARVEGETLPPKILKGDRYSRARQVLAGQCGEVLAGIHRLDVSDLTFLQPATPADVVANLYREYQGYGEARPVFELAFHWLREHLPEVPDKLALVHGDFRHGNLMVDEQGLAAVLDWELAFVGDPMADLGWLCVNSWRFGNIDLPVGGFGSREHLFDGYEAASGQRPDPDRVRFWEILGTLRWGIMCQGMAASFVAGHDTSPERGAIGRRASETEVDLLRELVPLNP
ncbi:tyrosine protein kinase:aminoglycoside phosphotransferase [Marinobacter zhanjiangensis]|uniref:Tyrosine protein kinase:aminoglycoside phosphotransferase n=2 Tax=Marinobacter zhanjiangensis TaxID=578215 RepID=A0ABQ3AK70_9GAMM|nr:tyrosine protein kinase:aminoglycoside phosphotransferase [Marinobacter zhanjiangensis]